MPRNSNAANRSSINPHDCRCQFLANLCLAGDKFWDLSVLGLLRIFPFTASPAWPYPTIYFMLPATTSKNGINESMGMDANWRSVTSSKYAGPAECRNDLLAIVFLQQHDSCRSRYVAKWVGQSFFFFQKQEIKPTKHPTKRAEYNSFMCWNSSFFWNRFRYTETQMDSRQKSKICTGAKQS